MKTQSLCACRNGSTRLHAGTVPYLTFPLLEKTGMVRHGFSTRQGGVSSGIYESMNLDFRCEEPRENVWENYRRLTAALRIPMENLVMSAQTHTTNIRRMTADDRGKGFARERDYTDVDGMITDVPGVALVGLFADCVPLLFVDPVHRAIGLSHAGWRGTVGKIGAKTVSAMGEAYGTRPADLLCVIGPSICRDCYEVSGDVAAAFAAVFSIDLSAGRQADYHQKDHSTDPEHVDQLPTGRRADEVGTAAGDTEPSPAAAGDGARGGDGAAATDEANAAYAPAPDGSTFAAGGGKGLSFAGRTVVDLLIPQPEGKYLLDLHLANALTLVGAGVSEEKIAVTDLCTCCRSDLLWSHRATHGQRGEMAGLIEMI